MSSCEIGVCPLHYYDNNTLKFLVDYFRKAHPGAVIVDNFNNSI